MAGAFPVQDQLLQKTETLRRASESLKRAQQVSEETGEGVCMNLSVPVPIAVLPTDQIGIEIIEDLSEQKESLLRTRSKVGMYVCVTVT